MFEKKPSTFKSPDLSKMQEVVIDFRTKIYISMDEDPIKAKRNTFHAITPSLNNPFLKTYFPETLY